MTKTALVLSGGGMFGAYQAGVWKALSREIQPDIVVGASVGALNGWLIAAGVGADEMIEHWLDPAAGELMAYRLQRLPWGGVFDSRPLRQRAKFLVEHYPLRLDYGVVLVRVPSFRAELVNGREVTWRHLVATCAVPGGFPPVRIGGAFYCDGGLLEALPVWAAERMGATRVIAVNALRFAQPRAVKLFLNGVRLLSRPQAAIARAGAEVTVISPKDYLGKFLDGAAWRRDNIERWIELGEADARATLGTIALSTSPPARSGTDLR